MIRFALLVLCAAACGRSRSVQDQDLPGLVVEARKPEAPIDVARAARDPVELGRALARPYRVILAALGPHTAGVNSSITVTEGDKPVSELSDHAQIDNGTGDTYHAIYSNSADYGRETTFVEGTLYLRPRYQRWHARDPETPDEPAELRDRYFEAVAATWDLLAPGAEVADRGTLEVGGRAGRKIEIAHAADARDPAAEPLAQRKWREARSVDDVTGEVVLDAERGVPLAVKLTGRIGFTRDGRRFAMKVSVDGAVSGIGTAAMVLPPSDGEVVATPERRREVDDRDYLLQGIAPPLRRNPDGTAIPPTPRLDSGELLRPGETPTGGARPAAPGATGTGDKSAPSARPTGKPGGPAGAGKPGDPAGAGKPGGPAGAGKPPARSGDTPNPARRANQDGAKP
ncbi:MAG TPA: hypothetical protein VHT91_33340 [Kofleriaceae bacterium]|jgi:hypothetical protein|nr:hypothetical protein [Kofleriaceae bacterium]